MFGQIEAAAHMIDVQKWTRPSKLKLDERWNGSRLNMQKTLEKWQKKDEGERWNWKEMKNTEKHSAVCSVWIIHTKTIKNGDGESDYKAARDDFDSQIGVWMKM